MTNVDLQFACVGPGGIGAFERTDMVKGTQPFTPVYIYRGEGSWQGWEPSVLNSGVCVSMFDVGLPPFMKPAEYRVWNEHFLRKVTNGLKGGGILTLVHNEGWEWHLGLAYSVFPLHPKYGHITRKRPKWWLAEDVWCEVGNYDQLREKVNAEQDRLRRQFNRELAARGGHQQLVARVDEYNARRRPQRPPAVVAGDQLAHLPEDAGHRMREALRLMGQDADDYERNRQR